MSDIYLHVGLPKTGTTSIQAALDASIESLARHRILVPAGGHRGQRLAVYDLLGNRTVGGDGRATPGSFAALVAEMRSPGFDRVVVSEEVLTIIRPRQVRRVVQALEGHRVHVVVGVRDLARTLPSAWQQAVVMGSTTPWREYVAGVRSPGAGSFRAGLEFGMNQDVLQVLAAWEAAVPPERIHVVTVPPRGAPPDVLLDRFARAVGIPAGAWRTDVHVRNEALGVAETELLRRVNVGLAGRLAPAQYRYTVELGIRPRWEVPGSRRLQLPHDQMGWVRERSHELIAELAGRGWDLVGDLDDLRPLPCAGEPGAPDEVSDEELLAAAEAALTSLVLAHGQLFRHFRRRFREEVGRTATTRELVASNGRALWFRVQRGALGEAQDHALLAAGVRHFARLTGRIR